MRLRSPSTCFGVSLRASQSRLMRSRSERSSAVSARRSARTSGAPTSPSWTTILAAMTSVAMIMRPTVSRRSARLARLRCRSRGKTMGAPRVQVEAHPPERGKGRPVVVACGCSCCCCCCCLHTVGGVVGAAVMSAATAGVDGDALASRSVAKRVYWLSVLFLVACIPGPLFAPGHGVHELDDAFWIAFLGVALGLLLIQLAAAGLSAIALLLLPRT